MVGGGGVMVTNFDRCKQGERETGQCDSSSGWVCISYTCPYKAADYSSSQHQAALSVLAWSPSDDKRYQLPVV